MADTLTDKGIRSSYMTGQCAGSERVGAWCGNGRA